MDKLQRFFCGNKGQSMVEFAVTAPLLILILYSIMYASEMYIIKTKVLIGARTAAWSMARAEKDIGQAKAAVAHGLYFAPGKKGQVKLANLTAKGGSGAISLSEVLLAGCKADPSNNGEKDREGMRDDIEDKWSAVSVDDIAKGFTNIIESTLGLLFGSDSPSGTTGVTVRYALPMKFGPYEFNKNFEKGSFNVMRFGAGQKNITNGVWAIEGTHYVGGNSWHGMAVDVHDVADVFIHRIKDLFNGSVFKKVEKIKNLF